MAELGEANIGGRMVPAWLLNGNANGLDISESSEYPGCFYRKLSNGGVEWFNPPMLIGAEYRTVERYLGKPVYVKLVSLGAGPNSSTSKSVEHGISSMGHLVDYGAELTANDGQALSLPYYISDANQARMYVNSSVFCITTASTSLSGYNKCYGWAKYTKTTD